MGTAGEHPTRTQREGAGQTLAPNFFPLTFRHLRIFARTTQPFARTAVSLGVLHFQPLTQLMKREFITCKTLATAKRRAPWASKYAKAENGWWAFESFADYNTWRNQK